MQKNQETTKSSKIKCLEWTLFDKTTWTRGEWDAEVDKVFWVDEETGYLCIIQRVEHSGHLCGYVGVPPNHPFYKKDYNYIWDFAIDIQVHCGITFADTVVEITEIKNVWFFGFDCAHCNDQSGMALAGDPKFSSIYQMSWIHQTYRNLDYVKKECINLAKQLKELEKD